MAQPPAAPPMDPQDPPEAPQDPPHDPRDPPQSLGSLRGALEAALLRAPGAPGPPPELAPLLALPLPPPAKMRLVPAARLLRDNMAPDGGGAGALSAALAILEKYGRNLLQPRPPPFWRCVRATNPVFRSTVGALKGGRGVLRLLGYRQEGPQGLSFPPGTPAPHGPTVAAVTADLALLRAELGLLLANKHPNPQFFTDILRGGQDSEEPLDADGVEAEEPPPPCPDCVQGPCGACARLRHTAPPEGGDSSSPPWRCAQCGAPTSGLAVLCGGCQPPRHAPKSPGSTPKSPGGSDPKSPGFTPKTEPGGGWACASCTFLNPGPAVLCGVCERPRLAPRPPPAPQGWRCGRCTYWNRGGAGSCALCLRPPEAPPPEAPPPEAPPNGGPPLGVGPAPFGGVASPGPAQEAERQERLRRQGQRMVELLRAAEAQAVPAEAVLAAAGGRGQGQGGVAWAKGAVLAARAGLGAELAALGGAAQGAGQGAGLGSPSPREVAAAWLRAHARAPRALQACLGARRRKLRALAALGFPDRAEAAAALSRGGGALGAALAQLQRPRLGGFAQRLWEPCEPPLDFQCPDQQALVRRVLASLSLPSWGRAQLVAALGRELAPAGTGLEALVEAVRASPDRASIRRRLRCECAVCGWALPREQMQSLTGCECAICPECFRQHFTIGVKERRVADLVCPACGRPDLADEAQRLCYFSTLDVQLRQVLDAGTYQLFTQKLTERELLRDPKFVWCIQCSFGFIFEAEQGPAQCPQCQQRFCPRCQCPWEPQHRGRSCSELQLCDPQEPPEGLAAFLQERRIACPQCGLSLALARGGCLHLQCPQCQHSFCSACSRPFHRKDCCPEPGCPLRGSLHGHHPRHCLFYLRDWHPERLLQILTDAGVSYETEPPPGAQPPPGGGCWVPEQKETPGGLRDEACGREAPPGQAGLCRAHYAEYLVSRINAHALDPAPPPDPAPRP